MKLIPLRESPLKTIDIIRMVVRQADKGMDIEEMRRRVRILKAIDAAPSSRALLLEDADHAALKRVITAFGGFAVADAELLDIIDEIIGAQAPPAPMVDAAE